MYSASCCLGISLLCDLCGGSESLLLAFELLVLRFFFLSFLSHRQHIFS